MVVPVLYSTQPWFAYHVGTHYRGGQYYVWCSEQFSAKANASLAYGNAVGPTSDPINIYEQLYKAVQDEDFHSTIIKHYRRTFKNLARTWMSDNSINKMQCDEIVEQCKRGFKIWRPVLFVIPRPDVDRIERIAVRNRAAAGPELRISDLRRDEFDVIELPVLERRA